MIALEIAEYSRGCSQHSDMKGIESVVVYCSTLGYRILRIIQHREEAGQEWMRRNKEETQV